MTGIAPTWLAKKLDRGHPPRVPEVSPAMHKLNPVLFDAVDVAAKTGRVHVLDR